MLSVLENGSSAAGNHAYPGYWHYLPNADPDPNERGGIVLEDGSHMECIDSQIVSNGWNGVDLFTHRSVGQGAIDVRDGTLLMTNCNFGDAASDPLNDHHDIRTSAPLRLGGTASGSGVWSGDCVSSTCDVSR